MENELLHIEYIEYNRQRLARASFLKGEASLKANGG